MWGIEVQLHSFLNFTLGAVEWIMSLPGWFTPGDRARSTYRVGDWVGPRVSLDILEKRNISSSPAGMEHWFLRHPTSCLVTVPTMLSSLPK